MRAPDGTDHWLGGTYREIVENERLVFTHAWRGADGQAGHETVVTVAFSDAGAGRTRVTLHQAFFATGSSRAGHEDGWSRTFDNLARYIAS